MVTVIKIPTPSFKAYLGHYVILLAFPFNAGFPSRSVPHNRALTHSDLRALPGELALPTLPLP